MQIKMTALIDFPGSYAGMNIKEGDEFLALNEDDAHVFRTIGHAKDFVARKQAKSMMAATHDNEEKKDIRGKQTYQTRDMQAASETKALAE